jgi:hypothetical protein
MKKGIILGVFAVSLAAQGAVPQARPRPRPSCWGMSNNVATLVEADSIDSNSNNTIEIGEVLPFGAESGSKHILIGKNLGTSTVTITNANNGECGKRHNGSSWISDTRYPTSGTSFVARNGFFLGNKHHAPKTEFIANGGAPSSGQRYEVTELGEDTNPCSQNDSSGRKHWFYKVCLDEDGI